ncbi:MAG: hypothetical protein SCK57_03145 [Bacillota bacterium]|nr:hypothetical protein [Bacillota bacterium]MDW7676637.1 hypothetical protein [Bacillota bacterium]
MVELYGLTPTTRILVSIMLVTTIALQSMRLFLMSFHRENKVPGSILAYELSILVQVLILTFITTIPLIQRQVAAAYFHDLRGFVVMPIVLGLWITVRHGRKEPTFCAGVLMFTLSLFAGQWALVFFLVSCMYLFARSLLLLQVEWETLQTNISSLSLKEAVDRFPVGLLYADKRNRTLIRNPAMNQLLDHLNQYDVMDTRILWHNLSKAAATWNIQEWKVDDNLLVRTPGQGAWFITKEDIITQNMNYKQILAADITEEDKLTGMLEERNQQLEELQRELEQAAASMDRLIQEKEIVRMKTQIHDVLGQRLTILGRLLEAELDAPVLEKVIRPLITDLGQLIRDPIETSHHFLLSSMVESYAFIGTAIHITGQMPERSEVAMTFVEIIRECCTNALRHGQANNVYLKLKDVEHHHCLEVQNDGTVPNNVLVEGGGIAGMRRRVEALQGNLSIILQPQFVIQVRVPRLGGDEGYD